MWGFRMAASHLLLFLACSVRIFGQSPCYDAYSSHIIVSNSRYLRLFRHTGWESVLEGEVTEMGVGFVMKRKAPTLKMLFRSFKPRFLRRDSVKTELPTDSVPMIEDKKEETDETK